MDRYLIAKNNQGLLKVTPPSTDELARYGFDLSSAQVKAMEGRAEKIFQIVQRDYPNSSVDEHIKRSANLMSLLQNWSDDQLNEAIKREASVLWLERNHAYAGLLGDEGPMSRYR